MTRNYFTPVDQSWGEGTQGLILDALRLVGAVWVMWAALRKNLIHLVLALFIVGVGPYIGLIGFYIMILGMDGDYIGLRKVSYPLATCELLYIAAGFVVGWAVTWSAGVDVERGYSVFGATSAPVFAALTGLAMLPTLRTRAR